MVIENSLHDPMFLLTKEIQWNTLISFLIVGKGL
jgi:hypothetical protein